MPNALGAVYLELETERSIFFDGISMNVFKSKKRWHNKNVAAIKKRKTRLLFAVMDALVDLKSESVKKRGVKIWFRTPQTDKTRRRADM